MDLGYPFETIVNYLLIKEWFSHVKCTSTCDAHWIGPIVNHDTRLSIVMIHQATKLYRL